MATKMQSITKSSECCLYGSHCTTADICGQVKSSYFLSTPSLTDIIDLTCYETLFDDEPSDDASYCNLPSSARADTTAANCTIDTWLCSVQDVQPIVLNSDELDKAVRILEPAVHYDQQVIVGSYTTSERHNDSQSPACSETASCGDQLKTESETRSGTNALDDNHFNSLIVHETEQEVPDIILENLHQNPIDGSAQIESTSDCSQRLSGDTISLYINNNVEFSVENASTSELVTAPRSVQVESQSSAQADHDSSTEVSSSQYTDTESSQSPARRIPHSCPLSMPSGLWYDVIEE